MCILVNNITYLYICCNFSTVLMVNDAIQERRISLHDSQCTDIGIYWQHVADEAQDAMATYECQIRSGLNDRRQQYFRFHYFVRRVHYGRYWCSLYWIFPRHFRRLTNIGQGRDNVVVVETTTHLPTIHSMSTARLALSRRLCDFMANQPTSTSRRCGIA